MAKRGFTLIEVLVAMVIMSIGLLAILRMTAVYIQANTNNLRMGKATSLAQDKMEQLRSYAVSDRVDRLSVFDFDYLVSTSANFTTVLDPATNSNISVNGLLSGPTGTQVTTPWGTVYEVLYDDGTHGDIASGDGIYSGTDTQNLLVSGNQLTVTRVWTVEPVTPAGYSLPEYALLTVTSSWIDNGGTNHQIELMSCVNRRQ